MNLAQITRLDTGFAVVEASGDLDLYNVPRLREALTDLHRAGWNLIVVDMSRVTFMDSSGLGVLIGGIKRAKAGDGELVLAGTQERELRILRVTGVVKVLPCFATLPEAFAHLEARP